MMVHPPAVSPVLVVVKLVKPLTPEAIAKVRECAGRFREDIAEGKPAVLVAEPGIEFVILASDGSWLSTEKAAAPSAPDLRTLKDT